MSIVLGSELNSALTHFFAKRTGTAILATIDEDLRPHTAPFHYIWVGDPGHLHIAIFRNQQTFTNISNHGYVALAVLDEGDLAVSIKGFGRILCERMDTNPDMAIIEVEVIQIRNNTSPSHFISQGIRIHHKNELCLLESRRIFAELMQI